MPTPQEEWFVVHIHSRWYAIGFDGVAVTGVRVITLEHDRYETLAEAVTAVIRRRER